MTTANDTHEKLVSRFPRALQMLILAFGVAGVTYLVRGSLHGALFLTANEVWTIVAAGMVVLSVAVLLTFNNRIEIDVEEIVLYHGARAVRRAPIRSIQEIHRASGRRVLRFEGGEKFTLNDNWENAAAAVALFQTLLDAGASAGGGSTAPPAAAERVAASPPPAENRFPVEPLRASPPATRTLTLPLEYATFPAQCLSCGRPPKTTYEVRASRHVNVLLGWHKTATVSVPVCRTCRIKRQVAGTSSLFVSIAVAMGWIIGYPLIRGPDAPPSDVFVILGGGVALMLLASRGLNSFFDRRYLGLKAVRLRMSDCTLTLRFRDADLAATVAELTKRRREQCVLAAKQPPGKKAD